MIISFADKETEKIYRQEFSRKLPSDIQSVALRKLIMINNAQSINDLRIPPSNRLELLRGDRKGFRICFNAIGNQFLLQHSARY